MAIKLFADTNIIIDFIEQRPFDLEELNNFFELAENHKIEIWISETVITNAANLTKNVAQVLRVLKITKVLYITIVR